MPGWLKKSFLGRRKINVHSYPYQWTLKGIPKEWPLVCSNTNMDSCCKVSGLPEISLLILLLCMGRQMQKKKPSPVLRSLYLRAHKSSTICVSASLPQSRVIETFPRALLVGALASAFSTHADGSLRAGDRETKLYWLKLNWVTSWGTSFPFPREATEYETCIKH